MVNRTILKATGMLSFALGLWAVSSLGVTGFVAAKELPAHQELSPGALSLLENRFFSHSYAHDPIEKRLERLECLVFGSMRDGSNEDRFVRLKKVIAARSASPLVAEKATPNAVQPPDAPAAAKAGSSQYPILNTLEWRALKKTFPAESLDQRLERLESKLFGQPSVTMAYVDRVERLKKTLGVGLSTGNENANVARGPMPKARPRSEGGLDGFGFPNLSPDGDSFGVPGTGSQPAFPEARMPGLDTIFGATFDKRFQRMFEDMNRQMLEARKLGPGAWTYDQKSGSWIDMQSGRKLKLNPNTFNMPSPSLENPKEAPAIRNPVFKDLPLYSDPNSI